MAAQGKGGGRRGQGQRELGSCFNQPQDDKIHVLERAHPQCLVAEQ